jgi:hypothetical protein
MGLAQRSGAQLASDHHVLAHAGLPVVRVQPWWPHLVNLLLHAANTVLLFSLFKRMTGAVWRSAAVAALFALHPLARRIGRVGGGTQRCVEHAVLVFDDLGLRPLCGGVQSSTLLRQGYGGQEFKVQSFLRVEPVVFRAWVDVQTDVGHASVHASAAGLLAAGADEIGRGDLAAGGGERFRFSR